MYNRKATYISKNSPVGGTRPRRMFFKKGSLSNGRSSFIAIKINSWIKVTLFLSLNREEWMSFLETSTVAFFFLFFKFYGKKLLCSYRTASLLRVKEREESLAMEQKWSMLSVFPVPRGS